MSVNRTDCTMIDSEEDAMGGVRLAGLLGGCSAAFGYLLQLYMLMRVRRRPSQDRRVSTSYDLLVRAGEASGWVAQAAPVCIAVGSVLLFGAMLLGRH